VRVHIGAAPGGAFFVGDSVRRWVLGLGPGLMPATRAVRRPPLRLTRRGRIVFTLWMIAERHAPRRDRFATIEEIRRLNGLDGYGVRAGQRLVMPRAR